MKSASSVIICWSRISILLRRRLMPLSIPRSCTVEVGELTKCVKVFCEGAKGIIAVLYPNVDIWTVFENIRWTFSSCFQSHFMDMINLFWQEAPFRYASRRDASAVQRKERDNGVEKWEENGGVIITSNRNSASFSSIMLLCCPYLPAKFAARISYYNQELHDRWIALYR